MSGTGSPSKIQNHRTDMQIKQTLEMAKRTGWIDQLRKSTGLVYQSLAFLLVNILILLYNA